MRSDIFPNRAKQPRFLPLRDYALVLFVAETGARRRKALSVLSQSRTSQWVSQLG